MSDLECTRCGVGFDLHDDHTELVRRDFRERPQPSVVEHLCGDCRRTYLEEFLSETADSPDSLV
jgi:hypothetical protein